MSEKEGKEIEMVQIRKSGGMWGSIASGANHNPSVNSGRPRPTWRQLTLSPTLLDTFAANHIQLDPHGLTSDSFYFILYNLSGQPISEVSRLGNQHHATMTIDEAARRSHILHRALNRTPLNVASGSGISFTLNSGKEIIDAASGPSVACLGHNQPEVTKAILDHLNNNIAYAYSGSFFTNDASEELASLLLTHQPGGLSKAIFVNSGSEATDAALKLAVQYWHEKGEKKRTHFIARKQSYHGNTIGALCVSGHDSRREFYKDFMSSNVSFVDPCYAYRLKECNERDEQYAQRLAQQVEDEILRVGPEHVAGFIAETVSGTTLGCVPAVPGYFSKIRDICDKYGVLLILDEVRVPPGQYVLLKNYNTKIATDNVRHGKNRNHACLGARRWLPRAGYTDNRQGPWWWIYPSIGCAFTRKDIRSPE